MNKNAIGFLGEKEFDLYILTKTTVISLEKQGSNGVFCERDYRKNENFSFFM